MSSTKCASIATSNFGSTHLQVSSGPYWSSWRKYWRHVVIFSRDRTFTDIILQTFIAATEKISHTEVALIFEVIPLINRFTQLFGKIIDDESLHIAIRHAANTALTVLNRYYSPTDDTEMYRIAMSEFFPLSLFL